MPKKSERHLVCQSLSCQRGAGCGGLGICFRGLGGFPGLPPICPGMINACHVSGVFKQMWPVVKTQTRTILQIQNCLFGTETIKLT